MIFFTKFTGNIYLNRTIILSIDIDFNENSRLFVFFFFFRTFYNAVSKNVKSTEVIKSVNLLFSTLEPQYVWIHSGYLFEKACENDNNSRGRYRRNINSQENIVKIVGSGMPELAEVCALTEFLLESVSLDGFIDTPSEHLPTLFHNIIDKLSGRVDHLSPNDITKSLKLCGKILAKVQPAVSASSNLEKTDGESRTDVNGPVTSADSGLVAIPLEKSQSDSKLNKPIESTNNSFSERSPR